MRSRLVAIARHATDIASQARGIEHGDILLGVAGTVQLLGQIRIEEPELLAYLIADAARHLPPATRYEIRLRPGLTMLEQGIERTTTTTCWCRDPAMDDVARWGEAQPGAVVDGYLLLGQYRTPKGT